MNNFRLRGADRKMTLILPNIHAGTAACVIVDIVLFFVFLSDSFFYCTANSYMQAHEGELLEQKLRIQGG